MDSSQAIVEHLAPNWDLPEILGIQMRRIPFEAPKHTHIPSALAAYTEAIEFLVKTNRPIPARALGPALFIGEVQASATGLIEDNLYRFLAFDLDSLHQGDVISWGWMTAPKEERQETKFRFELQK
jgi:hypothetical protein